MMGAFALLTLVGSVSGAVDTSKWDSYDSIDEKPMRHGLIVEYADNDDFCRSWIIPPGFSLIPKPVLAIIYFLILCYLFLGIAIIADIFML